MNLTAALIYWIIIALWLTVLWTICVAFVRNPRTFGTVRLLLSVLLIDTLRNIIENVYFGLYFGSRYGLLPSNIGEVLGNPHYLILPKVMNVVAACTVLLLLALRWLPLALREKASAETDLRENIEAYNQEAEERRRLFDTSLDLILITDRKGTFVRVSPSSFSTIGYQPEEMIGRSGQEFIFADDLEGTRQEMKLARSGQLTRNFETRYVHKNGHIVPLAWSGVWSEPEQKHFFFGRDMSDQKIAEEQLRQLAHYDRLTGLPNRATLEQDVAGLFGESPWSGKRPLAITILALDGFKDINDTLGHSVGDRLLKAVGQRLSNSVGNSRVYRLGGDEFALLVEDCGDPIMATEIAETAIQEIAREFEVDDHRLFIAASAGIAIGPSHGANLDDLLASADLALHEAKASGGRTCRLYEAPLRARAKHRRELDTELRRACANHEFVLYFQPQVRAVDGTIVGAEALLRWNHPVHGVLAPGAFIEALGKSAVANETGRWILNQACKAAASWRAKGLSPIRIGVNLFPAQFRNGSLLQDVEYALRKSGLPPEALELEITENIALGREEGTLAPLRELRSKGIGIAFDDFGTGYASLSYLMRYPLTRIKIDRSFIQKIGPLCTPEDTAIVRSIIMMGRNLGLDVIAEGVETSSQADFLKAQGCPELQGYLFSKPVSCKAFEILIQSSKSEAEVATGVKAG